MTVLTANSVSALRSAIVALNSGIGGTIEIPAGAEWTISDPFVDHVGPWEILDNAFPLIRKDITITTDSESEYAVLKLAPSSEFRFFEVWDEAVLTLRNISFCDSELTMSFGMIISCNYGSIKLENCRFENNTEIYGGVMITGVSGFECVNCIFQNNSVSEVIGFSGGDAAHIKNTIFANNIVTGTVLRANKDTVEIINTQFWENASDLDICQISASENMTVINCGFFGNITEDDILNATAGPALSILECRFIANSVAREFDDGAVRLAADELRVTGCHFENNRGGIRISGNSEFRNCNFADNDCRLNALIVNGGGGPVIVRGSLFRQNIGPLVYTSYTDTDIRFNSWEIPPDASRFVERYGGQVIYDGPINPPAPCPQSGGQSCCALALG